MFFTIRETGVPDCYVITGDAACYIRIAGGSAEFIKVNDAGDGWDVISSAGNFEFAAAGAGGAENAKLTISNPPGRELPPAGGPGTDIFYLIGILLIALAGAGMVMKKRTRGTAF